MNGTVGAKEIIVTAMGWADYVFSPQYRLAPLKEVAAFIENNHRLPGIPSEEEVKERGVAVGEIQSKLLAKIEELTLHVIRADAKNEELEGRIRRLEAGRLANAEARETEARTRLCAGGEGTKQLAACR